MKQMNKIESYIPKIIQSLQNIDPYKIILFGSVATGTANDSSDLDIAVILNKESLPEDYDEKLENKILVRNAILDISFEVPFDLLVYTTMEFEKLKINNKPFYSEIVDKGKVVYEKAAKKGLRSIKNIKNTNTHERSERISSENLMK